jgi:hypothetical protein
MHAYDKETCGMKRWWDESKLFHLVVRTREFAALFSKLVQPHCHKTTQLRGVSSQKLVFRISKLMCIIFIFLYFIFSVYLFSFFGDRVHLNSRKLNSCIMRRRYIKYSVLFVHPVYTGCSYFSSVL